MSALSTNCKTVHMLPSPSSRECTCESVGLIFSQGGFLTHDQGQMLGTEPALMEMTEVEYTDLQCFIKALDGPGGRVMTTATLGSTVVSPHSSAQSNDLSTSTDEHNLLMLGQKTPSSYNEVPGFVWAKIRDDHSQNTPGNKNTSSLKRTCSAARVCLEKRYSMFVDTPKQQDDQTAVLSDCLTILQQSAEAEDPHKHPQKQKQKKTDRTNTFETSNPYVIGHIPQMADPKMHQSLINSFPLNIYPAAVLTKAHLVHSSDIMDGQQSVKNKNEIPTLAVCRKHGSAHSSNAISPKVSPTRKSKKARKRVQSSKERRERHNTKERERRRRIRVFCDELNTLVPFCDVDTDTVTTLQWTTAFLKHIKKTHGDAINQEFEKLVKDKKGLQSSRSEEEQIHLETDETMSIHGEVQQ